MGDWALPAVLENTTTDIVHMGRHCKSSWAAKAGERGHHPVPETCSQGSDGRVCNKFFLFSSVLLKSFLIFSRVDQTLSLSQPMELQDKQRKVCGETPLAQGPSLHCQTPTPAKPGSMCYPQPED